MRIKGRGEEEGEPRSTRTMVGLAEEQTVHGSDGAKERSEGWAPPTASLHPPVVHPPDPTHPASARNEIDRVKKERKSTHLNVLLRMLGKLELNVFRDRSW
jgi:hypothetical protein